MSGISAINKFGIEYSAHHFRSHPISPSIATSVSFASPIVIFYRDLTTLKGLIKWPILLFAMVLFSFAAYAADECLDAEGKTAEHVQCSNSGDETAGDASSLPPDVLVKVKELRVQMRYFMAIGFHKQSQQKRDAIQAIYAQYSVPLPAEYQ